MSEITFTGASDDLVEISGAPGADEVDPHRIDGEWNVLAWQSGEGHWSGAWDIVAGTERLRVHAIYDGTWSFAPGLVSEDDELPSWEVRVSPSEECGYSVKLTVVAPEGAVIEVPYPLEG